MKNEEDSLACCFSRSPPLEAQQSEMQAEAMRAFQAGDYATAKSLFESLLSIDPKNPAARNYLRAIAQREKGGPGLEGALKKNHHSGGGFSRRDSA